jgi:hypothetical protein
MLGALPILCCYVASIPHARDNARHTLAFILVAVGMGMLCFVLSACYIAFRRIRRMSSSLDSYSRSTETVKNISDGVNIFQVIYLQVMIDCFSIASKINHNCFYHTSKPECAIPDDNCINTSFTLAGAGELHMQRLPFPHILPGVPQLEDAIRQQRVPHPSDIQGACVHALVAGTVQGHGIIVWFRA